MDSLRNMIIERKVIELITEHAKIKSTKYELPKKQEVEAVDLFLSSNNKASNIPEAKYEDSGQSPLPTSGGNTATEE